MTKLEKQPSMLVALDVHEQISILAPTRASCFKQWAAWLLGVPLDTPTEDLATRLIDGKHTVTNDEALEQTRRTNSFYFYFRVNNNGGISVGHVNRGRLSSRENSLDSSLAWGGFCLLVRNVNPELL